MDSAVSPSEVTRLWRGPPKRPLAKETEQSNGDTNEPNTAPKTSSIPPKRAAPKIQPDRKAVSNSTQKPNLKRKASELMTMATLDSTKKSYTII